MPAGNVEATATTEKIPYSVTVTGGTGSGNYTVGNTVSITANVPAGYRFVRWDTSTAVTYTGGTNANSNTAKFTMPAQAVTATAVLEVPVTNISQLRNALSSGTPGRIIRLQNNIGANNFDENGFKKDHNNWGAINITNGDFILDGNGFVLTMAPISSSAQNDLEVGLLGKVTGGNITIKNLGVIGQVEANSTSAGGTAKVRAGGLAALVSGGNFTVENTYFVNTGARGVRATRDSRSSTAISSAGGFFGEITTGATINIFDCFVYADVEAHTQASGAGKNSTSHAGGFVGWITDNANLTMARSYAAGSVTSYAYASATATRYAGGLVGLIEESTATATRAC